MQRAIRLGSGAVIAAVMLTLAACQNDQNRAATQPPAGSTAQTQGASVDAIKEGPARFYGKTVRVTGEIDKIYSDRAFDLEGTGWAFDDNITVLTSSPVSTNGVPLRAGDDIIVLGTVRPFVVADVERDVGWDIGSDVEIKLNKRPVLIATSIRRVGEYGSWPATGTAEPVKTTLAIVITDPAVMVGRKVDLGQERVQAVQGKGLWVGYGQMSKVFVLPKEPVKDIKDGDNVRVTGTLQKAPHDAAKAWDLPAAMAGAVSNDTLFVDAATVTKADTTAAR